MFLIAYLQFYFLYWSEIRPCQNLNCGIMWKVPGKHIRIYQLNMCIVHFRIKAEITKADAEKGGKLNELYHKVSIQ